MNAIAPGHRRTDNTAALQADAVRSEEILRRILVARWGESAEKEGAIIFFASSASDYLSGHIIAVDGGWLCRQAIRSGCAAAAATSWASERGLPATYFPHPVFTPNSQPTTRLRKE